MVGKGNHFIPYREALTEAVRSFGFEAESFDFINHDYKPDCFIVINPFQYETKDFRYDQYVYAGIQTEQLPNEEVYCFNMGEKNYKRLKKCINRYDFIFEWSPAIFRDLKKTYKHVYFFPHCNFDSLEYKESHKYEEGKYDIFFAGWATGIDERRKKILELLCKRYNVYPKFQGLWGEEKEIAMMSSKICLNIHFDNSLVFESPRMYEFLSNKRFVLSEKISDSFPFVEGVDYDAFYVHNIFEKIDYYLAHPIERQKIALNGYDKALNMAMSNHIHLILERFLMEKGVRKSNKRLVNRSIWSKLGLQNNYLY
ncbi:glycosyltransferase family 1 protein [Sutcliffiella horikoshii]|uniref:Glycosyltransferase family 1 protein n=1 Tax=Sutcliffiella horikoshii TaxID=79883 RepID=A0AA94WSV8_9BACI|nr:glycosyltransferase [Sutcliffiella horikoshii]TYS60084.1 glycosyltransferase family 1 protein [Sutcliffiella horikoshii]